MKKIEFLLNIILTCICLVHIIVNLHIIINPVSPSVKKYEKQLENIDFPLIFKVCLSNKYDFDNSKAWGYQLKLAFFEGKSRYNNSIYGWSGHSEDGNSLGNVEGKNI